MRFMMRPLQHGEDRLLPGCGRYEGYSHLGEIQPEEMNVPGFDFHALRGNPIRYTVHVNGPWCVTFELEEGDALRVDFEQYH